MKLTRGMFNVLEAAERNAKVYGPGSGMMTGRRLRRRDAERCAGEGLLETQMLAVMDGDFAKELWTERWGYVLTELGAAALLEARARMVVPVAHPRADRPPIPTCCPRCGAIGPEPCPPDCLDVVVLHELAHPIEMPYDESEEP